MEVVNEADVSCIPFKSSNKPPGTTDIKFKHDPSSRIQSDEELSDLDDFKPLSALLAEGGDVARRVEFILNMFGRSGDDLVGPVAPSKRNKSAAGKVVGLDPTRASTATYGSKKRLGSSRFPRKDNQKRHA